MSSGFESGSSQTDHTKFLWRLVVEHLDVDVSLKGVQFGYSNMGSVIDIPGFSGTKKIANLGVYPVQYYAGPGGPDGLKERLVERGRRWAKTVGEVSHSAYKGIAYVWHKSMSGSWDVQKFSVSRSVNLPAELP